MAKKFLKQKQLGKHNKNPEKTYKKDKSSLMVKILKEF
jgi:hypothetical protein